jgi:hypothetical protein
MSEKSKYERSEQEDLMARGPVSRGAENEGAPMNEDTLDQQATGGHVTDSTGPDPKHPDYNKMVSEHPTQTAVGSGGPDPKRDLGTVGGGTIPSTSSKQESGINTSNSTVAAGGTSANQRVGAGLPTDRGGLTATGTAGQSTNEVNRIDRHAQGNLGGRNPGQPQTAMGDQDATRGNRGKGANEDIIDPMTSRTPEKIQQESAQQEDQKKQS